MKSKGDSLKYLLKIMIFYRYLQKDIKKIFNMLKCRGDKAHLSKSINERK